MPDVNPGTTNLVSWWSLDETGGTRNDSHGSNHLAAVAAPGSATGKVGNAIDLEMSSAQYLTIADNASLSADGADLSIGAWVNLESFGTTAMRISGKWGGGNFEYMLDVLTSSQKPRFLAASNGASGIVTHSTALSLSTWYFIVGTYSDTSNLVSIYVNAGSPTTAAHTTPTTTPGSASFRVGNSHAESFYFDGLIDEVFLYKNRVLTLDEITWLYNSGNGRAYSALTAAGLLPSMLQHAAMGWR